MKRSKTKSAVAQPLPYAIPVAPSTRHWPVVTALAVGFVVWALLWGFQDTRSAPALQFNLGPARWTLIALAALVAAYPPVARLLTSIAALTSSQLARRPGLTTFVVMGVSTAYLILTAHLQERDLFPKTHDDQSYLIQMQMLARFRLWMPQHPIADFFDTFYVISRPVYASFYFPGASLMYVPTIWLNLPTWLMPTFVAGTCVGMAYAIVARVLNPSAGLLVAVAMVSLEYFRVYSVLLTGHEPMLLLGLLTTWAWLNWRSALITSSGTPEEGWRRGSREVADALKSEKQCDRQKPPPSPSPGVPEEAKAARQNPGDSTHSPYWAWAIAIGVFAGWGAITRPADAVCWALPIGIAMLIDLMKLGASRNKRLVLTGVLVVAGAAPFLSLQLVFNKGVTGRWLESPFTYGLNQDHPNSAFGFRKYDPADRPVSTLQQKQDYYDVFFAPYILRHEPIDALRWWGRVYLPMTVDTALPVRLAIPLVCVGILAAVRDRRRWVIASVLPLFLLVYYFYIFFLEHYALQVILALLFLTVLGIGHLASTWPRWTASIRAGLSAGFLTACLLLLPEFNPLWAEDHQVGDETFSSEFMDIVKQTLPLADDLKKPAVILFSYRFGDPLVEDPVYNTDVAWPDDAPVIYARDLGPRNQEIFDYYAKHQPTRHFYRFDRNSAEKIQDLGSAVDLARK